MLSHRSFCLVAQELGFPLPLKPKAMSDEDAQLEFKVKVLMDSKENRVLCLECGKEFAELLISLLMAPVGAILKLVADSEVAKSCDLGLFNLYGSVDRLDGSVWSFDKTHLVSQYGTPCDFLRITAHQNESCLNPGCHNATDAPKQLCDDCGIMVWSSCSNVVSKVSHEISPFGSSSQANLRLCLKNAIKQSFSPGRPCSVCKGSVSDRAVLIQKRRGQTSSAANRKRPRNGLIEKNLTFIVKENLSIERAGPLSALEMLQSARTNLRDLTTKEIVIKNKEVLQLVSAAMVSKTPLTDVFGSVK